MKKMEWVNSGQKKNQRRAENLRVIQQIISAKELKKTTLEKQDIVPVEAAFRERE